MKKQLLDSVEVVDLFCGIGGMTHGFLNRGFKVVAGIDNDPKCKYGYEKNNGTNFIEKDVLKLTLKELAGLYSDRCKIRILIGCAPCQPFSGLNPNRKGINNVEPLRKFARLISRFKPEIVSMENVKNLADVGKFKEYDHFISVLKRNKYKIDVKVVNCENYGVPQTRKRLVLLASRLGEISLIDETHDESNWVTVRDAIGNLEPIKAGETDPRDSIHRAYKLSPLNMKRIKATPKNGGSSKSWDESLKLKCHQTETGKTYRHSVYGRMRWDTPGPTMTTQCIGLGNGRFGHPEQNRAISLREAALLQTFPEDYEFHEQYKEYKVRDIARFIGNAVPVTLAEAIAESIKKHVRNYVK